MTRDRLGRAVAESRDDVARLEEGLAAAAHERDLKAEEARLAAAGVAELEQRIARLKHDAEKELAEARTRLQAREEHLENAKTGIESRDRRLEVADENLEAARKSLEARGAELTEAREATGAAEKELAEARARLELREEQLEAARQATGEKESELAQAISAKEAELAEAVHAKEGELAEAVSAKEGELAEAREAAQAAEKELAEARARLQAREEHLENAKAGIESRDRRLAALEEKLELREREAAQALEGRDTELKEVRESLAAQRAELVASQVRLEMREGELSSARRTVEEKQEALEQATEAARQAAERERAETVRAEERIRELEGELTEARLGLAEKEEALAASRQALAEKQEALTANGQALAEKEEELAASEEALAAKEEALKQVTERLKVREKHLENAKLGVESRDRKLAAAARDLESREAEAESLAADLRSRDAEIERLRLAERDRQRSLALAEARLEKSQERSEHFEESLAAIRKGSSYRLMRILWRLRHPFRRARRAAEGSASDSDADDDDASGPPVPASRLAAVSAADSSESSGTESKPSVPAVAVRSVAPPPRGDGRLRVASILDEMSAACFAPECDLVPLTLEGWREQLDEQRPDLLLVESAWNGNGGEWQYRIAKYPRKDLVGLPALRELLSGCHERGIPTAFWNKEDPVHFDRFSEAAALFDHVFTTDARCVERYRGLPGERTVTALPFAAQPRIHNPVAAVPERSTSPCFAGAWYRDRHPDRRRSLEALLDAARPYGLVIYDRNFGVTDEAFGFPERFSPHVLGKLPYESVLDVYKSHRVFLNANSVVDSPTMCSRRVFELAACDTAILSTPGAALSALLGDSVVEVSEEGEAAEALEALLGDDAERARHTRAARRTVFAEHTYADRLATIAETAGLDATGDGDDPWVLRVQRGITLSEPALADLRAAATFADADIIGTRPARNGDPAVEHRHVSDLDPRALLIRRELVETRDRPPESPDQIEAWLRERSAAGARLYAADGDLLTV